MGSAKRPIRVGLFVRWPTGGIRTHLKYLYLNLPAGKYQPIVVAPRDRETDLLLENLSVSHPDSRLIDKQSTVTFARLALRSVWKDRLDIVHSHGFTSAALAGLFARMLGIPHVATIHEVITETVADRLGRIGLMALGLALQQATVIHAVGDDLAANLADKLLTAKYVRRRLRVIRNGIDLPQFSNVVPRSLRMEQGIGADVFLLGFLGRYMAPKGFRTLIEAVSLLHSEGAPRAFKVLAVGDGGFVREDRAEVIRRGLGPYFVFHPPVEDAAPTLAALDCLVMPSIWEAFPLLAGEALCLGVPLIASDCVGLREAVVDSPARTFQAGKAADLATAIRKEMIEPTAVSSRNFIPEARRRFDVRVSADKMDQLFDEVVGN